MEGKKQQAGRPQIYNGEISELAQRMEDRRRAVQEETVQRQAKVTAMPEYPGKAEAGASGPVQTKEEQKTAPEGRKLQFHIPWKQVPSAKRKREQENLLKMQVLGVILGVLILILAVALVYEVGFGYGTKQTGKERMAVREETMQKEGAVLEPEYGEPGRPLNCRETEKEMRGITELWMNGI